MSAALSLSRSVADVLPFVIAPAHRHCDWLDYDGAMRLAVAIRDGWWRRGQYVEVWLECDFSTEKIGRSRFVIRSDLVGGRPRRACMRGEEPHPVILRRTA